MVDIIDSRDLLEELRDLLEDPYYDYTNDPADAHREEGYEELAARWTALDVPDRERVQALRIVLEELPESTVDGRNSWGSTLIPEDEFEDYARELASDVGAISGDEPWPLSYIDWTRAADALKADYTTVEFDGTTYLCR